MFAASPAQNPGGNSYREDRLTPSFQTKLLTNSQVYVENLLKIFI